jgi:hypothetical protein
MTRAEEMFHSIAASLPDTQEGKMFGALCIKAPNGKAGVMLHTGVNMIFKLPAEAEKEAMKLKGAQVFEPMAGRPMNGWTQLGEAHADKWPGFAATAMEYVRNIDVAQKPKKRTK